MKQRTRNPMQQRTRVRMSEVSAMSSIREPDATGRLWRKVKEIAAQLEVCMLANAALQREYERLRTHSSGVSSGIRFASPILYDPTRTYSFQQVVVVTDTATVVVDGLTSADAIDAGDIVHAMAGTWVALQTVTKVNAGTEEAPAYRYHLPRWPMPTPDNPDDHGANFWYPFSAYLKLIDTCDALAPKAYANEAQKYT